LWVECAEAVTYTYSSSHDVFYGVLGNYKKTLKRKKVASKFANGENKAV